MAGGARCLAIPLQVSTYLPLNVNVLSHVLFLVYNSCGNGTYETDH